MKPRLIFPFSEEKAIKSIAPNERGVAPNSTFIYKIFPKFNPNHILKPRVIQNFNTSSMQQ